MTHNGDSVSSVSVGEFLLSLPCRSWNISHAGIRVRGLTIWQCDVYRCHHLHIDLF